MGFLDSAKSKLMGPAMDIVGSKAFGPANFELYQGSGDRVKQYITGQSGDVRFAYDSLMFAFPALDIKDSYSLFDYEFVIHNGSKVIARLVLPIPPQSISYNVPTAVQTTVTMRGITEEHNAAPLRQIALGGTFGVYPIQPSSAQAASGQKTALDYFFANTVNTFQRAKSTFDKLASAFSNDAGPFKSQLIDQPDEWTQTSYTLAHNMDRFFSAYLEAKKGGTIQLYLGFNMHKDKMYFDCTLNNYSIRKQAGTVEYMYQVGLTAWRRREAPIGTVGAAKAAPSVNSRQAPNVFARLNGALNDARTLIGQSLFVLKGVQGDIYQNILTPLKTANLLVKDAAGIPMTLGDFPKTIVNEAKGPVLEALSNVNNLGDKLGSELKKWLAKEGVRSFYGSVERGVIEGLVTDNENDPQSDWYSGPVTEENATTNSIIFESVFEEPDQNGMIFDNMDIDSLELTSELRNAIDNEIEAARNLTYNDIGTLRDQLNQFTALFSQRLGGQDPTFNAVFGLASLDTDKKLGTEDIDFLIKLDDASAALDELVVILRDGEKDDSNDYAKFYGEYARTQGIDFQENTSKFYVPFPFGASLESLAVQYLGDANRWIEIAAINGLKQPYIDEEGMLRPLTSSGSGNAFFLESSDYMYIGQVVTLQSDTQIAEPRRVTSIDIVSEIQTIVTVDGEPDLSRFKLVDNAQLRVFMPNTVNSRMLIAVPTTTPVNVPGNIKINPSERDLTNIGYVAKSDFMLINFQDGTADIGFIGSDVAISEGMANIVQAAQIKLRTKRGELVNDPDFGNPIEAGDSIADFDANTAIAQLSQTFAEDSRFNRVAAARIQVQGRAATIDLLLDVVKSQAYLPITTVIPWI